MLLIIFGIVLFLVLIVYVVYIAIQKEKPEEVRPTIHTSGIYSVVRRSPRENIRAAKAPREEIREYLDSLESSPKGDRLAPAEKNRLIAGWEKSLEENILVVENGDRNGVEIYFYRAAKACSQNEYFRGQNKFVTREEIYRHPKLIPPFHLGCKCRLVPDTEWKKGQSPEVASTPLLEGDKFQQPDWKVIEREL